MMLEVIGLLALTLSAPDAGGPLTPAAAGAPLVVDLASALRLGLAHDRDRRMRALDTDAARAAVTKAGATYQPKVSLENAASTFDSQVTRITSAAGSANNSYDVSVHVQHLLFDTGQGLFEIYRTRQLVTAARGAELAAELTAAGNVSQTFYEALRAAADEKLAGELLAQAQRQQELAQARFAAGKGARLDVTRAAVTVSNAKVDLTAAANRTGKLLAQLRSQLGLPPGAPLAVSDKAAVPPVETGLREALDLGTSRPELSAAAASAQAQRHALTAVRLRRWVRLALNGTFDERLINSRDVNREYTLSGTLSVPLWDGLSGKAEEEAALAAWRKAGEQVLKTAEQIQVEVEQSYLAYADALARLKGASEAVALAADSLAQTDESYRQGVASLLELSDSRTGYAKAETSRVAALLDRDQAAVKLRLAVGRMPFLVNESKVGVKESGK